MLFIPLVHIAQYFCWISPYNILGFLDSFYSLGILNPFHSFLLFTFPWALTKSFGLPQPNYHILCFWVYWPSNQSYLLIPLVGLLQPIFSFFLFLMIPMGLPFHSSKIPCPVCLLWSHFVILWACRPLFLPFEL